VSIDWPDGFERTPADEREPNRSFQAMLGQTTKELATEMDRLDPDDWRASTGSGGSHTKSNGLPKASANPSDPGFVVRWTMDGEQFAVACDASPRLRDNARAVYLWIHETRMRGKRPVVTGESEFAAARLPPADDEAVVASEPPHEVLGVAPDADPIVVEAAARSLKKKHHPDAGGDVQRFKQVVRAEKEMLGGESA
jgi:DnaJ-domain-containing protein 1